MNCKQIVLYFSNIENTMENLNRRLEITDDQTILDKLNELPDHYHATGCITLVKFLINCISTCVVIQIVYMPQFDDYCVKDCDGRINPIPLVQYIESNYKEMCKYKGFANWHKLFEENENVYPAIKHWITCKNFNFK